MELERFVRAAWPILEPVTPLRWNWHLSLLCEYLGEVADGRCRRLIVNVPPRTMKSLLCTVLYPVWTWTRYPERRFMFVSYSEQLSTEHSIFRRNVLNSDMYRAQWGEQVSFAPDQNRKRHYENTRRGVMFATSITGSATGKGCDELIVDDPLAANRACSDLEREATNQNFDITFRSRLNNPEAGAIVVIMQRLHENDLTGHLLEREPNAWRHLRLPAEAESKEQWYFPRTANTTSRAPGDLLWPERLGTSTLAGLKKALGSWAYSGQYQQNPAPLGGGMVKREWLRYFRELPATADIWLQSWDCSFKDTPGSDYVVGQVWCRAAGNYYLVEQRRERMDFVRTKQAIREMTQRYPQARAKLIEDKANGPAVISAVCAEIDGVIAISPRDPKIARMHSVAPLFQANNIYLPEKAEWTDEFVQELTRFPKSVNDDQVDACTQALMYLSKPEDPVMAYYRGLAKS